MTPPDRDAGSTELEREVLFFEELVDTIGVGVGVYDDQGRLEYVNGAYAELLGTDEQTLEGTPIWDINPLVDRERFDDYWRSFDQGETRTAETTLAFDGREVPVQTVTSCRVINDTRYHLGTVKEITERKAHRHQIAALHAATREMVKAADVQDICEIAIRTAEQTFESPTIGLWLAGEHDERLEPAAMTDAARNLYGEHPVYTEGDSPAWRAYASGESLVLEDVQDEAGSYNADTRARSEVAVPLGEFGVFNMTATAPGAFTDDEITLAKTLATNTLLALERADRERHLERQTAQMEFFNSILRHDVLNAVTVIKSRAEFLEADLEGDQLRDAETIIDWSYDVKEIVEQVRNVLESLVNEGDPDLEPMDLGAELRSELGRVRSTYPEVSFDITIPDGVSVLANELLGDVLGNIVTNAIDHNDTDGLSISITVAEQDGSVIARIADDGQGVSDERKETVFRRDETGHAKSTGSGFGLYFVDVMMSEYGGEVWVEDNDNGGATFGVRLQAAEQPPATQ